MTPTDKLDGLPRVVDGTPACYRLQQLLRCREDLALAAAEHSNHDLPGSELLWQAVDEVEEHLRVLFPETWTLCYPQWVAEDVQRMHEPDQASAQCRLCRPLPSPTQALKAS